MWKEVNTTPATCCIKLKISRNCGRVSRSHPYSFDASYFAHFMCLRVCALNMIKLIKYKRFSREMHVIDGDCAFSVTYYYLFLWCKGIFHSPQFQLLYESILSALWSALSYSFVFHLYLHFMHIYCYPCIVYFFICAFLPYYEIPLNVLFSLLYKILTVFFHCFVLNGTFLAHSK